MSAVVVAVWTAWTWRKEHERVRQLQRDQAAAQYVNPFLLIGAELQTRLHQILDETDLAEYKQENPDPLDARHGFASNAFRFTMAEQAALGHAVVTRVGQASTIQAAAEFRTLTLVEFQRDFRDAKSERAPLYRGRGVRGAVEAIDRAERPETLEGRERLQTVRRLLLQLLDHLQEEEGLPISPEVGSDLRGERAAESRPMKAQPPTVLHRMGGRIHVAIPRLRADEAYANRLRALFETWKDVEEVKIDSAAASVAIKYKTTVPRAAFQARVLR